MSAGSSEDKEKIITMLRNEVAALKLEKIGMQSDLKQVSKTTKIFAKRQQQSDLKQVSKTTKIFAKRQQLANRHRLANRVIHLTSNLRVPST